MKVCDPFLLPVCQDSKAGLKSQYVPLLTKPRLSPASARRVEVVVEPWVAELELVTGSYSGFFPSAPPCCTMVGGSGVSKIGQVSREMPLCNDIMIPGNMKNIQYLVEKLGKYFSMIVNCGLWGLATS